jgi:deoxyribodipyrimidine photo-lyase
MEPIYQKSLFIFRRDLHIDDNSGLIAATEQSKTVIPCFIIDPVQIKKTNTYRSLNALQFMQEALQDLQKQFIKRGGCLYIFFGHSDEIVTQLISSLAIDAVYVNRDYTPFSLNRDEYIKKRCLHNGTQFHQFNDLLLNEPENIMTGNNTPYSIFTPFFNKARYQPVAQPRLLTTTNWYTKPIKNSLQTGETVFDRYTNNSLHVRGTQKEAMRILNNIKNFTDYGTTHDIPSIATTNLSAYIKFGVVSIRQVYHAIFNELGYTPLIRQLYWRDFFTHIAYFSPFIFGQPFKEQYKNLRWENNEQKFEAWRTGTTGFPIIDAGMRQLNETGYMHNRVRLLTGSFLVKDLHIDWRWGEQYFAQQLIDYDPSVNNGNWQWVASTGTDAQPYFRIFNPWLQQKKFDPDCMYIKKWVPELKALSNSIIHNLHKKTEKIPKNYPAPIIEHTIERAKANKIYKETFSNATGA